MANSFIDKKNVTLSRDMLGAVADACCRIGLSRKPLVSLPHKPPQTLLRSSPVSLAKMLAPYVPDVIGAPELRLADVTRSDVARSLSRTQSAETVEAGNGGGEAEEGGGLGGVGDSMAEGGHEESVTFSHSKLLAERVVRGRGADGAAAGGRKTEGMCRYETLRKGEQLSRESADSAAAAFVLRGQLELNVSRGSLLQPVFGVKEGELVLLTGIQSLSLLLAVNKHFRTPTVLVCASDKAYLLLIYRPLLERLLVDSRPRSFDLLQAMMNHQEEKASAAMIKLSNIRVSTLLHMPSPPIRSPPLRTDADATTPTLLARTTSPSAKGGKQSAQATTAGFRPPRCSSSSSL